METETLGLLSGIGHLPVDVAKSAKERGCRICKIRNHDWQGYKGNFV